MPSNKDASHWVFKAVRVPYLSNPYNILVRQVSIIIPLLPRRQGGGRKAEAKRQWLAGAVVTEPGIFWLSTKQAGVLSLFKLARWPSETYIEADGCPKSQLHLFVVHPSEHNASFLMFCCLGLVGCFCFLFCLHAGLKSGGLLNLCLHIICDSGGLNEAWWGRS